MAARGDFGDDDETPPEDARARMARILAQCGVMTADLDRVAASQALPRWHLWPQNAKVWALWCSLQTQWIRAGMDGRASGIDHRAIWADIDGLRLRGRRWVFEAITQMERAALDVWREQADQA